MALTKTPIELSSTPSIVDGGNATAITIDSSENTAFSGSVSISHNTGDSLTLTKTTTEPSLRIEGDTNKDFVLTVSGEKLTITQNDGTTDIALFDHDTKATTLTGNLEIAGEISTAGVNTITSNTPKITFIESDQSNKEYQIGSFGAAYAIYDASNSQYRYTLTTSGDHIFNEGGQDCDFRIESDDNANLFFVDGGNDYIGIGTNSPNDILDIHKNHSQLRLTDTDDSKFVQFSYSGGKLIARNNSTNTTTGQFTLTEDGNFGVRLTSPTAPIHTDVGAPSSADKTLAIFQSESTRQSGFGWDDSISSIGVGSVTNHDLCLKTHIASGNTTRARFRVSTNTSYTPDGIFGGSATPHTIGTTGSGELLLGYNDNGSGLYSASMALAYDAIDGLNNTSYVNGFLMRDTGNSTTHLIIETDGDVKNTNNSYGSLSDSRIKKDIADASSQWDDIKALKIRKYKLATQPAPYNEQFQIGVIAQELEAAGMSGLIKESDPDTKHLEYDPSLVGEKVKSVKYSVLYMKAIKALQEAMIKIEALEARVTTLEG